MSADSPQAAEPSHPSPGERFQRILAFAADEADGLGHAFISCQHLFYALAQENRGVASMVLDQIGITPERIHSILSEFAAPHDRTEYGQIDLAQESREAVDKAVAIAKQWGSRTLDSEHLLYGVLQAPSSLDDLLGELQVKPQDILQRIDQVQQTAPGEAVREEATHAYRLTLESAWLLGLASDVARKHASKEVSSLHLLVAFTRLDGAVKEMLADEYGVTTSKLQPRLGDVFNLVGKKRRISLHTDIQRVLGYAIGETWNRGHLAVTPLHIAAAFARAGQTPAHDLLAEYGASADALRESIERMMPPQVG